MSTTCAISGIAAPDVVTLAAAVNSDDANAAVLVEPDCTETEIAATAAEDPGMYMINASYMSIEAVASYPKVESLRLWFNAITSFASDGTTVKYIDISSNSIETLDDFSFPSSAERIVLDLNFISSTKASDFPDGLLYLSLQKNTITSLAKFRFPAELQSLYLTGNQQLTSLSGAVFPSSIVTLDCSNCGITEIAGVIFPSSLKTLRVTGATVKTFEIRESDVTVLQSATLQFDSVSVSSCSTSGATLTAITDAIQACVIDDTTFTSMYPSASGSGSEASSTGSASSNASKDSSSSTSTTTSGSGSPSSATANSPSSNGDTSGSSSTSSGSSNAGLYGGIAAGVVVIILLAIAFIIYRRKREKHDKDTNPPSVATGLTYQLPPSSNATTKNSTSTIPTQGTDSATGSVPIPPSSDSGYLPNDVRNDEALIPFRLSVDEIAIVRELAVGGFGVVFLATMLHDKRPVVVKRLKTSSSNMHANSDALRRFMGEIRLCARLEHPKIVRFVGVAWTNLLDLSLVLEFMPRGDLSSLLKRKQRGKSRGRRKGNGSPESEYKAYESDDGENAAEEGGASVFSWFDARSSPRAKVDLALDVAEAVVYLHSFQAPIIHRDLKAKNVLLADSYEAKLSDFGVSRERKAGSGLDDDPDEASTMTGGMGTTAWIAPEVLQGERYSEKADIFSYGILLAELDACGHPYNNSNNRKQKLTDAKIALLVSSNSLKPALNYDCPAGVRELILRCVSFHPRDRPSAIELHYELRQLQRDSSLSTSASRYHQGFV